MTDEARTRRHREKIFRIFTLMAAFLIALLPSIALADEHASGTGAFGIRAPNDLTSLSLEELIEIEVTSVSKKAQKLSEAPAAVFVLTQDDIRRSGAKSIPEALRLVPGLQVARIDANKWAISSRGFNGRFANKLLVLMDGRSVYTPLFSGVFWDMQDTLLEDIERIEVIRGPGATMWGANAVNGVINIITRNSRDTKGWLVSAGAGNEERGFGSVRYGGSLGEDTHYRAYIKYFTRDKSVDFTGNEVDDDWDVLRGGFRVDHSGWNSDHFTLQGDIYDGDSGITYTAPTLTAPFSQTSSDNTAISGRNLLMRWTHSFSETSDMALQAYYDRTETNFTVIGEDRDTYDIDFQHHFALGKRQDVIWGLGYRYTRDSIVDSFYISLNPSKRVDELYSAFVQDEIRLLEDRLSLTAGSKFEVNGYTGFEVQPSARLMWTPDARQSFWAAVSRAVRTPSRADHDIRINRQTLPGAPPTLVSIFGSGNFDSEKLVAYEAGYRVRPKEWLSFDIATFYNVYEDLRSLETGAFYIETSPGPVHIVVPAFAANKMHGSTYGVELAADAQPLDWLKLQAGYTFLQMELSLDAGSTDTESTNAEGQSPHNQFYVRTSMDLGHNVELDADVRYVGELPNLNIDGYATFDVKLAWKPKEGVELSLAGRNLSDSRHPEFVPELINVEPSQAVRSFYGEIVWRF